MSDVLFTWTAQRDAVPLEITGGRGARFHTSDGGEWIDFGSMTWNAHLGHDHAGMKATLTAAATRGLLAQPSSVFPEKTAAAERLLGIVPGPLAQGKVFLCLSGAEANENAVKMALLATGRRRILHRDCSYHGATLAMLSISGDPRRAPFPQLDHALGIPFADGYDEAAGDLESAIAAHPGEIAAVILEGVVGANGVHVPPPGYFRRVRALCDRHDVLLIVDEVLSGFGRTGKWFAVDHDGIAPDLLTLGKGLTAGYAPGGAVVVAAKVAQFFDDHVLSCGLTCYAHPLTCAAIVAAIDGYRAGDLPARAAALGQWFAPRLRSFAESRAAVSNVRGLGLLWAFDLHEPGQPGKPAPEARRKAMALALRKQRVHVQKRDHMLFIAPPLVVEEADLDEGLRRIGAALDEVFRP